MYQIFFTPHFDSKPAVICSQNWDSKYNPEGGDPTDGAVPLYIHVEGTQIKTGDASGKAQDRCFSFAAIG